MRLAPSIFGWSPVNFTPAAADNINVADLAFLACGPGPELLVFLGAVALGALALTICFLIGFVCLFTSKWKLGIWLASVPAALFAVAYVLIQQQNR